MPVFKKISRGKLWIPMLLIILVAVNWLSSGWHTRLDLTSEKRFTLSHSTKKTLRELDQPVYMDVFLKGNFPSGFKKLSSSTEDILREFREYAGLNLRYNFISPEESVGENAGTFADSLDAWGLYPINLTSQLKEGQQQQFVYPYALVRYNNMAMPVSLYTGKSPLISHQELNSAEAMLEFNLAEAIAKLKTPVKPTVGYAVGHGEPMDARVYDLVENVLKADYNLVTFDLQLQPLIPADIAALLIVKPTEPFSDESKIKLDQYVMQGGKLLWFIDRLEAEMDSLQIKNEVIAYDRGLNLNDQFFRYGARVNADLVMDLQCDYLPFDVNGNGQFELLPWNYFPVFESGSNHAINRSLGFISGRFVNSIDTVEAEGIRKTILLSTSPNSRSIATPALISGKENVNAPEDEKFRKQHIPVAVLLEGKFRSLYANRLSKKMNDSLLKYDVVFQPQSLKENKMLVVADGDLVLNEVAKGQPIPMGMNAYTYGTQREFPFNNSDFVRNSLSYMIDPYDLSAAKGKDYTMRLLDTKRVQSEKTKWQLLNLAVPVFVVLLFGFIFQGLRKRRFSAKA